ncbi:MAG: sodium/proton-translocating pyrophosphatase, partial [Flavobacteriaceae bacterium]|nr:sodium/proton-translocating pyrophosphatase [Flavobacteriaceae bacterium]
GLADYKKCVEISTKASIKEMVLPGILAVATPVVFGFLGGPEMLGGLLAGVTVTGVLMAIFQSNAGGAWDNAKKMFEGGVEIQGKMYYKGSEPHKAAVVGDTVGDPFKDTSGPSLNILLKLMSVVALVIAPSIALSPSTTTSEVHTIEKNIQISHSDMDNSATAIVTITTTENGNEIVEEKVFEGTLAEVKTKAEAYKNAGSDSEVKIVIKTEKKQ